MAQVPQEETITNAEDTLSAATSWVQLARPSKQRSLNINLDDTDYDPFVKRHIKLPTSDFETTIHLLKSALGTGIFTIPYANKHSGLWFGIFATAFVGFLCAYCIDMLVRCSHILCYRQKIPSMVFGEVAEYAFLDGPPRLRFFASSAGFIGNLLLFIDMLGTCCVYLIFVSSNISQIAENYGLFLNIRLWILVLTIPLIFMCLVRSLKHMVPFSALSNLLIFISLIIVLYYIFTDLPSPSERRAITSPIRWPLFFGIAIFALECIGVAMSLENNMLKPAHFIGFRSVLGIGMGTVVALHIFAGFFGYLKYGDDIEGSITLNLPMSSIGAQTVKLTISLAVYMSYTLQFYVALNILVRYLQSRTREEIHLHIDYTSRIVLVSIIGLVAAAFPKLGPFISISGSICMSVLGLIMPAAIELVTYYKIPGFGLLKWRLWKDIIIILIGILAFFLGTIMSILEFMEEFSKDEQSRTIAEL